MRKGHLKKTKIEGRLRKQLRLKVKDIKLIKTPSVPELPKNDVLMVKKKEEIKVFGCRT